MCFSCAFALFTAVFQLDF